MSELDGPLLLEEVKAGGSTMPSIHLKIVGISSLEVRICISMDLLEKTMEEGNQESE